jgi:hypothetical protein
VKVIFESDDAGTRSVSRWHDGSLETEVKEN